MITNNNRIITSQIGLFYFVCTRVEKVLLILYLSVSPHGVSHKLYPINKLKMFTAQFTTSELQ